MLKIDVVLSFTNICQLNDETFFGRITKYSGNPFSGASQEEISLTLSKMNNLREIFKRRKTKTFGGLRDEIGLIWSKSIETQTSSQLVAGHLKTLKPFGRFQIVLNH